MNSLKNLTAVANALTAIAQGATNNQNGTMGMKIRCHYKGFETSVSKERKDLEMERTKFKLTNQFDKQRETEEKIAKIPADRYTMIFALEESIDKLSGTKNISDKTVENGKVFHPTMRNVTEIYIGQDIIDKDAISYEGNSRESDQ